MGTDFAVYYSDILRKSALQWGVDVPLDGLLDDTDIPRPVVVETLRWQGVHKRHRAEIEFVTLNGLWSFTIDICDSGFGMSYGPRLKFCPPFPTRNDALSAMIATLRDHSHRWSPEILAWLDSLEQPRQLSLF